MRTLIKVLFVAILSLGLISSVHVLAQSQGMPAPGGDIDGDGVPNADDSDMDGDGLTNEYETEVTETNPALPDTDGDGLSDLAEITGTGIDPGTGMATGTTDPNDDDSDNDGFTDKAEREHGSNPNDPGDTPIGIPF